MTQRFHKQRGAVTLIGALFIIITLALMVQVLHRVAGSDILDTAVQNDSVEALFVAETGIEHASFRYANGSGCPGLAGVAANAGRGSFSITNAVLVGANCRIRVRGTVGSTGTAQANRTVDADLRLAANDGWIVGDSGTILRWGGAAWNPVASSTIEDLKGIHCISANDCWAVGNNTTTVHWTGSWNVITTGTNVTLNAVSCAPSNPDYCVAVGALFGVVGIVIEWNAGSWSLTRFDFIRNYLDVSCPGITCFVTSTSGAIYRYTTGGALANDGSGTNISMNGIDCTSGVDCWAVGNRSGNNFFFNQRNSSGWTSSTLNSNTDRENLLAISCFDSNNCKAVGVGKGNRYTITSWNGTSWSIESFQDSTNRDDLSGVHCIAADNCWAVGNYRASGNVIHWDGGIWNFIGAAVAANTNLSDVYMLPSGGGGTSAVTLVRWQEVVN